MVTAALSDAWDGVRTQPHRFSMDGVRPGQRCSLDGVRPDDRALLKNHSLGFDDGYVPVTTYYTAYNSDSVNMTLRHDTGSTSFGDLTALDEAKPAKIKAIHVQRPAAPGAGEVKPSRSEAAGAAPAAGGAAARETPVDIAELLSKKLVQIPAGADDGDGWRSTDYYKVIKYYKQGEAPAMNRQSSLLDLAEADKEA